MHMIPDSRRVAGSPFIAPVIPVSAGPEVCAKVYKVALVGFGTVGRSVAKILNERGLTSLRLTHVCNRNIERKKVDWLSPDVQWTENIDEVIASDVDILVEVVGGLEPAEQWVRNAIQSGKSVVTANKQLIAHCGGELLELARSCGQQLLFGASVAGGVPVLSGLQEGLAGDHLYKVCGILNGTCNYILSKIENEGISFEVALRQAQEAGFAEADPTDDIEGYDARAKLTILSRVGLSTLVKPKEIPCRPISMIDAIDFEYAHQLGCTIRQVSRAEVHGKKIYAAVSPTLVKQESPLARLSGPQNMVMATGEYGGETIFGGFGAGGNPTAVAVVSDLMAISQSDYNVANIYAHMPALPRKASGDFSNCHYVRFLVKDRPGIIAELAAIFGRHAINIDSVLQKSGYPKERLPFVITLEPCNGSTLQKALEEIANLDFLVEPPVSLPMLG